MGLRWMSRMGSTTSGYRANRGGIVRNPGGRGGGERGREEGQLGVSDHLHRYILDVL